MSEQAERLYISIYQALYQQKQKRETSGKKKERTGNRTSKAQRWQRQKLANQRSASDAKLFMAASKVQGQLAKLRNCLFQHAATKRNLRASITYRANDSNIDVNVPPISAVVLMVLKEIYTKRISGNGGPFSTPKPKTHKCAKALKVRAPVPASIFMPILQTGNKKRPNTQTGNL